MTPPAVAQRLRAPLLVGGAVVTGAVALRLRDPHVAGSWGVCPWRLLTGADCPGCGALRAVNLLTHGDVVGAASSNLLLVVAVPVAVLGWVLWARRAARGTPRRPLAQRHPALAWASVAAVAVVVLGFTVLRNLPAGSWLHS